MLMPSASDPSTRSGRLWTGTRCGDFPHFALVRYPHPPWFPVILTGMVSRRDYSGSGRAAQRAAVVGERLGRAGLAQRRQTVVARPFDPCVGVAEALGRGLVLGAPGLVGEGH